MKKTYAQLVSLGILVAIATFSLSARADVWSPPSVTPPGNNISTPINLSQNTQTKIGGMILNSGGATYGLLIPFGQVGIGTNAPASLLSVAGGVQVGQDSAACSSAKAGTLRFSGGALQICDGSSWTGFVSSSSATPAVGSVQGYIYYEDSGGAFGSAVSHLCNGYASPAYCDPLLYGYAQQYGCGTGYNLTQVTVFSGFYDQKYIFVCTKNSTTAGASCPTTGTCSANADGTKCASYTRNTSPSCGTYFTVSTCTNGTWSPTPGNYRSCSAQQAVYGCTDSNACNYNPSANVDDGSCDYSSC